MPHSLAILGSTGSIGTQALQVAADGGIPIVALAAGQNLDLLERQVRLHLPDVVSVRQADDARILSERLADMDRPPDVMAGEAGLRAVATHPGADTVLAAMVGAAGLVPVLDALAAGKRLALANKETLVAAGHLVMPLARSRGVDILPVDSEHSAIWQCLRGEARSSLRRILLTASGGPFRGMTGAQLEHVRAGDALRHPTWSMGGKITIDSATLMNKGLEVIEACWLFDVEPERIDVVIHPQSIIHSMIELVDGSVLAQMGRPDMKLPIHVALWHPERVPNAVVPPYDPILSGPLTFEAPNPDAFACLPLAYEAARRKGTLTTVLNAANEAAVQGFLEGRLGFPDIARIVESTMNAHLSGGRYLPCPEIGAVLETDRWARTEAVRRMASIRKDK